MRLPAIAPARAVGLASVAYAVAFALLGADRYLTFHAGADLGLFAQSIAGAFSGMHNTTENGSHFAYHFSPILYVLAPPLWLVHSALLLTVVQAIATASIAPALYLIARRRTSDGWAATLACIALLYPPLQGVTFTDFHEVAFVPAAAAWLLWAIDVRRFAIAAAMAAVLLATKEDQAPALAFLGIVGCTYFAVRREHGGLLFCALLVAASALTFFGYFAIVRPLAGAPGRWMPEHFYAWGHGGPTIAAQTQVVGRLTYLLEAFLPLAFLPFRSRVLVLAIPGFAEVLASREPLTYTMGQHYAAVWVPYVLVAFVLGSCSLLAAAPRPGVIAVRTAAALCAIVLALFSPLHLGHFLGRPSPADAALQTAIDRLPANASIGTYDETYAHLGFFPNARIGIAGDPQYVLYDRAYVSQAWTYGWLPLVERAVREGTYALADERDGIVELRRVR